MLDKFLYIVVFAAILPGCGLTTAQVVQTIATVEPVVTNILCTLAADQGAAEPQWEVLACQLIDPATGQPKPASNFTMKLPKAQGDSIIRQSVALQMKRK